MKTVLPLAFALALAPVQLVWSQPAAQPPLPTAVPYPGAGAFNNGATPWRPGMSSTSGPIAATGGGDSAP